MLAPEVFSAGRVPRRFARRARQDGRSNMYASRLVKAAGRAIAITAAAVVVQTSCAQTYHWINGSGGVWNNSLNWSPTGIPNSLLHDAIVDFSGSYLVTLGGISPAVDLLDIPNDQVTLHVDDAYTLSVNDIVNNGLIIVNGTGGPSATYLRFTSGSSSLTGSGELVLNAVGGNLARAYLYYDASSNILTQGPDHTIRGKGNIHVNIANQGTIRADANGEVLQLLSTHKSNTGLMQAVNGAYLQISSVTISQSGAGVIEADGGIVDLVSGGRINGGLVRAVNGGEVSVWNANTGSLGVDTNLEGTFYVRDAAILSVVGDLHNDAVLTVNPFDGPSGTRIDFLSNLTLSGSGEIVLNAVGGNLARAYLYFDSSSNVVTQAAEHTIRGKGNIHTRINNLGLVSADQPDEVLQLLGYPKTNSGTMQAVNGGVLGISGIIVTQNPGGQILANDGVVQVYNAGTINGGLIQSLGMGEVQVPAGYAGALAGQPRIEGVFNVRDAGILDVTGTVENNGVITINSDAGPSGTRLNVKTNQSLLGTGQLVLNAAGGNLSRAYLYYDSSANVLTHGPMHTIRGRGRIDVRLDNQGLVSADFPGEYLQLAAQPKSNSARMQAVNGAVLQFHGITLTQDAAGLVVADASTVQLTGSATISGGQVQSINNGVVTVPPGDHGQLISNPTVSGLLHVQDGARLSIQNGIVNNGTIVVNPAGGPSGTRIEFNSPATSLLGSGEIILNAVGGNTDRAFLYYDNSSNVLTQGSDHTIRGRGAIYTRLLNQGTVSADVANGTLLLRSFPKTNQGLMEAVNGGILQIHGITVTQDGGQVIADGGQVLLTSNGAITSGTIASLNGGVIAVNNSEFGGINGTPTISGRVDVRDGGTLDLAGAITNDATIVVNPSGGASGTRIRAVSPTQSISGSGEIVLNAVGGVLDRSYLYYDSSTNVMTNGPGHTIAGEGNIYVQVNNAGILSPGHALASVGDIGRLNLASRPLACQPGSEVVMQIAGLAVGQYDRITGSTTFTCDGTMRLEHSGAFTSAPFGTRIPLVQTTTVTGQFDELVADAMPWPLYWKLVYSSNQVEAVVSCDADFTPDGNIDFFDVQRFLAIFSAGNPESDLNGDGVINFFDVLLYLNLFSAGC